MTNSYNAYQNLYEKMANRFSVENGTLGEYMTNKSAEMRAYEAKKTADAKLRAEKAKAKRKAVFAAIGAQVKEMLFSAKKEKAEKNEAVSRVRYEKPKHQRRIKCVPVSTMLSVFLCATVMLGMCYSYLRMTVFSGKEDFPAALYDKSAYESIQEDIVYLSIDTDTHQD